VSPPRRLPGKPPPLVEIKYSEVQVNAPVDEGVFKKPGA
jgi:hypothetical protein